MQVYRLYDDDDYNSDDGLFFDGDYGEDIDFRYDYTMGYCENTETLSHLCSSSDPQKNSFAAAYIEPEYEWARQQSGMNDTDVSAQIELQYSIGTIKSVIDEKRDSAGMESNDFWIAYLLLGYQSEVNHDPPGDGLYGVTIVGGTADSINSFSEVPYGGNGAILFLETMRDADVTYGDTYRIWTSIHELGHQFGLKGDYPFDMGVMGSAGSSDFHFVPKHIKILRFRSWSPGF